MDIYIWLGGYGGKVGPSRTGQVRSGFGE